MNNKKQIQIGHWSNYFHYCFCNVFRLETLQKLGCSVNSLLQKSRNNF